MNGVLTYMETSLRYMIGMEINKKKSGWIIMVNG